MTARYACVIGDPISQSKSPQIHQFWANALGLDVAYHAERVTDAALAGFLAERRADSRWAGCNVTVPHKQAVLPLVDSLSSTADRIGAANCIVRTADGDLHADNSDMAGFAMPLRARQPAIDRHAVVLGAGGAARAVIAGLLDIGFRDIRVINRSADRIRDIAADFAIDLRACVWGDAAAALEGAAVIVNTTSLGMAGQPPLDLPLETLPSDAIVNDIVYAPLETGLLAAARARGNPAIDGLDMLIGQAAIAFELFFGMAPPRDRDPVLRALLVGA